MVYPQNLKGLRFIAWQSFRPLNGSHFFPDGSRLASILLYFKLEDTLQSSLLVVIVVHIVWEDSGVEEVNLLRSHAQKFFFSFLG